MRKWLLLALVLVGCGNSGGMNPTNTWPMDVQTTWDLTFNAGTSPTCSGAMAVGVYQGMQSGPISVSGSWTCTETPLDCTFTQSYVDASHVCIAWSGSVTGTSTAAGAAAFTFQMDATHGVEVNGTMTPTTIIGSAAFNNATVPFQALLQ